MRLIIAGSRGLPETTETVDKIVGHLEELGWHGKVKLVISGTATGGDRCGELYAYRFDLEVLLMPADWKEHKRAAGYRRNEQMVKRATHLFAIWDGRSKGTKHCIEIARSAGLLVAVRRFPYDVSRPHRRRRRAVKKD